MTHDNDVIPVRMGSNIGNSVDDVCSLVHGPRGRVRVNVHYSLRGFKAFRDPSNGGVSVVSLCTVSGLFTRG